VRISLRALGLDPERWLPDPKRLHGVAGRLVTEARVLCLLYEYGALHGGVRVRARPGDRLLPVDWGLRGDPDMLEILFDPTHKEFEDSDEDDET